MVAGGMAEAGQEIAGGQSGAKLADRIEEAALEDADPFGIADHIRHEDVGGIEDGRGITGQIIKTAVRIEHRLPAVGVETAIAIQVEVELKTVRAINDVGDEHR